MNFDYDKIYTAWWKDAMEEMQEKLKKEQEYTEQCQTMVLMLLEKLKEPPISKDYNTGEYSHSQLSCPDHIQALQWLVTN